MHMTTRKPPEIPADVTAIDCMQRVLGLSLLEAARVSAVMSDRELDLVERERSPVAIASLIYQAQVRAARRIQDPEASRLAVRQARADAQRHGQLLADRAPVGYPDDTSPPRDSGPRVYPAPPPHRPLTAGAA